MGQSNGELLEISMEGYQLVSGHMFAHMPRPLGAACTIWPLCLSFSKAAVAALNGCECVLIRVHPREKCLLLEPVSSQDKDSIPFGKGNHEIKARKIECRQFTGPLYQTWGLDQAFVYRAAGRLVTVDKKVMMLFDFRHAEQWRTKQGSE